MRGTLIALAVFGTLARAQVLLPDSAARVRPDWGRFRDSLEIRRLELGVRQAGLAAAKADFWHRLIPKVSLGASFGIRGLSFVDASDPAPVALPADLYRLTLSLSVSDLLSNNEYERACLVEEQARTELSLTRTRQIMERHLSEERLRRLRAELSLMEEVLRLSERLLRYYALLFDQGKTSFDVCLRAELQAIEARKTVLRLRSELSEISLN